MADERRKPYPFAQFEPKWQAFWEEHKTFRALNPGDPAFNPAQPKFYVLDMFPYPSGTGLHVGHPVGYLATDILARYKRTRGFNVLHPMGWDAFGLPAEQYAIKTGQHPAITTAHNIAGFKGQLKRIGLGYDWEREINTTDPAYFKWTQWIFLKLYNSWFNPETNKAEPVETYKGSSLDSVRLAYVSEAPVNWCPQLGTVLANEEVIDGKSEVGGFPVERRPMRQWMLRITAYSQRLIDELDGLEWPESIRLLQRNWIGRSEGAEVDFRIEGSKEIIRVFTTRPDTLFGATYMVLAPEHRLVDEISSEEQRLLIKEYREKTARKSDLERTELAKEKTGVFTGAYATNPVNDERIPIWIADYVLMGYGTGAIMAVPAHDERDWEFAEKFHLRIREVVSPTPRLAGGGESPCSSPPLACFVGEGFAVNSPLIDNLTTNEAKVKITDWLELKGIGKRSINYKLRDWLFSRQRYWGEPFPVIWREGKHEALPESELPVVPPPMDDFKPTGTAEPPLSKLTDWIRYSETATRETNTMPQWAGSCWYYLRYCDAKNYARFISTEAESYWMRGWHAATGVCLYDETTWHEIVKSMLDRALFERGKRPPFSLSYARLSEDFARLAKQASGDELQNFHHAFDVYSVRHVWKQHSVPFFEEARGGIAVDASDLENLPEILAKPDSVEFAAPHSGGLKRFITKKRVNGFVYVVEELRSRREQLHLVTFWKQKVSAARDVTPKAPPSVTSKTLRCTVANVLPENHLVKPGGVDLYVGGTEHAVLHLLYARFWHKVLFDLGYVSTPEPFQRLINQGLMLGEDGQKMSKSRGNVVNPDDVIEQYGADALRCYEMFMGPLEATKPWSMTGVEGVSRFLARVWRLVMEEQQDGSWALSTLVHDVEPTGAQLRVIHATIKKVTEDIETLAFNTAISQMMVFVNAFVNAPARPVSALRVLLQLLNPFAPHLTEELWEKLSAIPSILSPQYFTLSRHPWPEWEEKYLIETEIEIPIQVNGKLRDKIVVKKDATTGEVETLALATPKVQEHTAGKTIRKVIVVPGKLVNIVAG